MAAQDQKIIATAGLISVSVGSLNSIIKYQKPPSTRFLIGSGIAFLIFSAMGETETMGDIAKGLALGIMSTIILGEGGGVMTYFAGTPETDTRKPKPKDPPAKPNSVQSEGAHLVSHQRPATRVFRSDSIPHQPYTP